MKDDKSLSHYGILGMRWGVRRERDSHGLVNTSSNAVSEDFARSYGLRTMPARQLSNDEIQFLNRRLQLERQYADLTKKEVSKGRQFANDVTKKAANTVANGMATAAVLYTAKKIVGDVGGDPAREVFWPGSTTRR